MNRKWYWVIGALILLPVLAHLVYAIVVSPFANYYITVDQFVARSADSPVRVGGVVVPGSIRWDNATRTLRFQIAGERATLNVAYRAVAPDALRDQVTAIVEGARAPDGTFLATSVRVRCPHQYLPAGW
ncbi:MAG: cytochrome c maturation protein CcmE [Anaerolineae bacterium]|nr:cytochrome c maturation protein CcmE [Anaerolineae bacterium]